MSITKDDLYKNQYDMEILKNNIFGVSLLDILKTQKLTSDFCVKYILNPDFQLMEEEQITIDQVKKLQPHILETELMFGITVSIIQRQMRIRIDSFDFESFS